MERMEDMSTIKKIVKQIDGEFHDFPQARIHRLLEICVVMTGRGEVDDDYTKTIGFPMNDYTIYADPYYSQVEIISDGGEEMDLESEAMLHALADDLKKRILSFDRKRKRTREENTKKVFDRPIDFIRFD